MKIRLLLILFSISNCSFANIILDGQLDDEAWSSAQNFSNMIVVRPYTQSVPEFNTEIKVTSDESGIYFGITNWQPLDSRNNE